MPPRLLSVISPTCEFIPYSAFGPFQRPDADFAENDDAAVDFEELLARSNPIASHDINTSSANLPGGMSAAKGFIRQGLYQEEKTPLVVVIGALWRGGDARIEAKALAAKVGEGLGLFDDVSNLSSCEPSSWRYAFGPAMTTAARSLF